tara:strand:+ start:256 stop:480 length:225 start_codon:yes stop_codon:yes gene_type:complete
MSAPFEVVLFVVVLVVVFVCPSLLFVVVAVYPPVMLVLEPDVLVCVFVSLANVAVDNNSNNINSFFISPPEEKL